MTQPQYPFDGQHQPQFPQSYDYRPQFGSHPYAPPPGGQFGPPSQLHQTTNAAPGTAKATRPVWAWVLTGVSILILGVYGILLAQGAPTAFGFALALLAFVMLIVGVMGLLSKPRSAQSAPVRVAGPVGYTSDGSPIYPVVGYTADGTPITADRAVMTSPPYSADTNGLAVAAIIFALMFPPIGFILGGMAKARIKQTGERGGGLATAAIIIGGIFLAAIVIFLLFAVFSVSSHVPSAPPTAF